MSEPTSTRRYCLAVIALCMLALAGNWLSISLFFGVDLIFGSVAVMLAAAWLGFWAAGLVALVGALYTLVLWGQPFAMPAFVLEGFLVAWLYRQRQLKNLVLADLLFWVAVGIPVVIFFYGFVVGLASSAVGLIALKQAINGVFNALLAGLLILLFSYLRKGLATLSLSWIVFHCMLSAILLAGIAPIMLDARSQRYHQERVILDRLNEVASIFAGRLEADPSADSRLDYHLARMQGMFPTITLGLQTEDGYALAEGRQLQIFAPAFTQEPTTSQQDLNIWLPAGDFSAVARWRAGYYWLQLPLNHDRNRHMLLEYSAAPVVQRMETQRLTKFGWLAGIFLLAIVLAWLIGKLLSRPVARLADASQQIERGVLDGHFVPLPGHMAQEFDQLSSSLNRMGSELASSVKILRDSRGQLAKSVAARTQELADTNGLLSSVLNAAEDFSIIATDSDGLITLFNSGAQNLLGYASEQMVGRETPGILHDPEEVQKVAEELSASHGIDIGGFQVFVFESLQGIRQPREWTYIARDGRRIAVRLVVSVIRGADGAVTGYLGIAEDISVRKQLEQVKSEFISTVSHELRTPLTSISGALGMLKAGALGELAPSAAEMVALAHNNSLRLANLINDLLDIEKIAAGKLYFDYQWVALSDQLTQALASIAQYAPQQQVVLDPLAELPAAQLHVDPQRLQQVLANLLSNAVKFSPPGGQVTLTASVSGNSIRISVKDQGEGIAEEFQERIFQRFAQADSSDQRKKGGTGLGLAISKELIEHMGGRIGFDSKPGHGASFWIELPCRLIESALQQTLSSKEAGQAILVVEDDLDAASVLQAMLEQRGFTVMLASTAQQALTLCEKLDFSAITLDLGLPDMDGLLLLRRLRERPATQTTPVVVVSGRLSQGELELLEYQPRLEVLPKPIDAQRLIEVIRQQLLHASGVCRILHVEDNLDLHQVIRQAAGNAFDFQLATSLAQARTCLRTSAYDLVLLDLGLPDGNGAELVADIRQQQQGCGIMLLTGQSIDLQLRSQVDAAFMKSSLSMPELLSRLNKLISRVGSD